MVVVERRICLLLNWDEGPEDPEPLWFSEPPPKPEKR